MFFKWLQSFETIDFTAICRYLKTGCKNICYTIWLDEKITFIFAALKIYSSTAKHANHTITY
jgi:hypothetical protein